MVKKIIMQKDKSKKSIVKKMGYTSVKQFMKENMLPQVPSKRQLLGLQRAGHTKKDSTAKSLEEMQAIVKELVAADKEITAAEKVILSEQVDEVLEEIEGDKNVSS